MLASFTWTALLAGLASAQFQGNIFTKEGGDCPKQAANEAQQPFTFISGTNICADLSGICTDGKCKVALSALTTGTNQQPPAKIGACPGSDCSQDCATWDVESTGQGIRVDCVEFTGQHYFYLGV